MFSIESRLKMLCNKTTNLCMVCFQKCMLTASLKRENGETTSSQTICGEKQQKWHKHHTLTSFAYCICIMLALLLSQTGCFLKKIICSVSNLLLTQRSFAVAKSHWKTWSNCSCSYNSVSDSPVCQSRCSWCRWPVPPTQCPPSCWPPVHYV